MILGPYGFNGASYFTLIENQSRHIVRCLARARRARRDRVEVTRGGEPPLLRDDARPPRPPGLLPGHLRDANSYYFDAHGDVPFRARRRSRSLAQRPLRPRRLPLRVAVEVSLHALQAASSSSRRA